MADATVEIEHLWSDITDHKGRLDEHEGLLDIHTTEIKRVSRWALDGNGESAETRIKTGEIDISELKKCIEKVASDEGIARIAREAAKAVVSNARDKDRTLISKVRAFAPYFAAVCMLIATVATVLLK